MGACCLSHLLSTCMISSSAQVAERVNGSALLEENETDSLCFESEHSLRSVTVTYHTHKIIVSVQ
jgi:hypothetical protein